MTYYIRKSISAGPFRFNLSKSGVGVSVGVRGLRFGKGPRGNYVHMGRGGLYYRQSLGGKRRGSGYGRGAPASGEAELASLELIESGDVESMIDASSREMLEEIRAKRSQTRQWPLVAVVGGFVTLLALGSGAPAWIGLGLGGASIWIARTAHRRDVARRSVVLLYELDGEPLKQFERLQRAFRALSGHGQLWHVPALEAGSKRVDGDTGLLRTPIAPRLGSPPGVECNLELPVIPVGTQTLFLLPDRVMVWSGNEVGAVSYRKLDVHVSDLDVAEDDPVGARVAVRERTWRHITKSGRPDRRYKDNDSLTVAVYAQIRLSSRTGLDELLLCSDRAGAVAFVEALRALGARAGD